MRRCNKAQISEHPIISIFLLICFILITLIGLKIYNSIKENMCKASFVSWENSLKSEIMELASREGSVKQRSYTDLCGADSVYFVDSKRNIPQDAFNNSIEIQNHIFGKTEKNMFLIKKKRLFASLFIGELSLEHPYYICFNTSVTRKLDLLITGRGDSTSISHLEANKGTTYDCTDYSLPKEIEVKPSLEKASSIILNSSAYLEKTFGLSQQEALRRYNESIERVEIDREFKRLNASTRVTIKIRPKSSKIIDNFIYIEDIPKACLGYLSDYEIENENGEVAAYDPVIAWHFASIENREDVSYVINDVELETRCKDLIDGMGLAENFVDLKEGIKNDPPILSIPDITLAEDSNLSIDLSNFVSDPDDLKRDIKLTNAKSVNMNLNLDNYLLTIIPNSDWHGEESVAFSASDKSNVTMQNVIIRVTPVNDAPVFTSEPKRHATQYQEYNYLVTAKDLENDPIVFSLVNYPVGMSIDNNGNIAWKPGKSGTYNIKIKVADIYGAESFQEYILTVQQVNKPPTIANIPNVKVNGTQELKDNVISSLWIFASDDTDSKNLDYSISSQSNPDLVSCSIDSQKNLDCTVKNNNDGSSDVAISVSDGEFSSSTVLKITVEKYMPCIQNIAKKCDGNKIYWFDSCDKKGSLYYNCKDNWIRNQCHNGKCCIGNLFCQEPSGCKDECKPDEKQCSGPGYKTCGDYNNDGCFEWSSVTSCGSDYCDSYGSWTCKDSKTKTRSRTCYKSVCANGNCDSALWQDTQTEPCPANQVCQAGGCIAPCTSQTCSSLNKQCGTWADGCGNSLNCGSCGSGQKCDNGQCVNAIASLSASYSNLQPPGSPGGKWFYDITLRETGGIVGITVNQRQKCYSSSIYGSWCDSVKTDISNWFGTNYISPGNQISWYNTWTQPSPGQIFTVTETFWGVDSNGNNLQASYSFTVP